MLQFYTYLKTLIFLSVFLQIVIKTQAQSSANYLFESGDTAYLYADANGNTIGMDNATVLIAANLNNTRSGITDIGFPFFFMGEYYSQFSLNDNGVLSLGPVLIDGNTWSLNGGSISAPYLSAFASDSKTGIGNGRVAYKVVGSAPERCLVVEYKNMQLFNATSVSSDAYWQIRLYEQSGKIEYVYGKMYVITVGSGAGNTPSIGFLTANSSNLFGSVALNSHSYSTTGSFMMNPALANTGSIPSLSSESEGNRRYYSFTPAVPAAAPSGLSISNIYSDQITLNWLAPSPSDHVIKYAIFKSANGSSFQYLTNVPGNTNSYTAGNLSVDTLYTWRIYAISEGNCSQYAGIAGSPIISESNGSGDWNSTNTWANGVIPSCNDDVRIKSGHIVSFSNNTSGVHKINIESGAQLLINSGSLTVGCTDNNSHIINKGTLQLNLGTLTINGNVHNQNTSTFTQNGGILIIDGNSGTETGNVASGKPLLYFESNKVTLSDGLIIITDPHTGTGANDRALVYNSSASPKPVVSPNHTLQLGNGLSTNNGSNIGLSINQADNLLLGNVTVNTLQNTSVVFGVGNTYILGNLYIINGDFNIGNTTYIAGNIHNDGTLTSSGTIYFGAINNNFSLNANPNSQSIGGSGIFRNNAIGIPTANFENITINNYSALGLVFTNSNSLRSIGNIGTVRSSLNFIEGTIRVTADSFILGVSGTAPGTLTYTKGGFSFSSKFTRWYSRTSLITTYSETLPELPFFENGLARHIYLSRNSAAFVTEGTISAVHYNIAGTSNVNFIDAGIAINRVSNSNWILTAGNGLIIQPTQLTLGLRCDGLLSLTNTPSTYPRISLANSSFSTHASATGTSSNPIARRSPVSQTQMTDNSGLHIAYYDTATAFVSVRSGDWHDPNTWNKATIPTCNNIAYIAPYTEVNITTDANVEKLTIQESGSLTLNGGILTIGCTKNNNSMLCDGNFTLNNGTLNINGNLKVNNTSVFTQNNGFINVDGNNENSNESVFASNVALVSFNSLNTDRSSINLNAGTFTIVDPHIYYGTSLEVNNASAKVISCNANHIFRFGNGTSVTNGTTSGFRYLPWNDAGLFKFGNLVLEENLSGLNRFLLLDGNKGNCIVSGNLTIKNGAELRQINTLMPNAIVVAKDLRVETGGTLTAPGFLIFATVDSSTTTTLNLLPTNSTQQLSNTGVMRNALTNPTANVTHLILNNSGNGLTLNTPLIISTSLNLSQGTLFTSETNLPTLLASANATSSAGTGQMVDGPMAITFSAANTTTGFKLFPLGKNGVNNPIALAPKTNGGEITIKAEYFGQNSGTGGPSVTDLTNNHRWEASIINNPNNFDSVNVRIYSRDLISNNQVIVQASSANGIYDAISGGSTYNSGNPAYITATAALHRANYKGYFSFANATTCTARPIAGHTQATNTSIICAGTTTLSLNSNIMQNGLNYQWQYNNGGGWINFGLNYISTVSPTLNVTTHFRAIVKCIATNEYDTSTTVTVNVNPVYGGSIAGTDSVCLGNSAVLYVTDVGQGDVSYQWQESIDNIIFTDLNDQRNKGIEIVPNSSKYYRLKTTCNNGGISVAYSTSKMVYVLDRPEILSVISATRCGIGSVQLEASTTASSINWYDQADGGTLIASGNTYTTPDIYNSTTYWVEAISNGAANVGKAFPVTPSSVITPNPGYGLVFNALSDFFLKSTDIYLTGNQNTGQVIIGLRNESGTELRRDTFNVNLNPAGVLNKIPLNYPISQANGYRLVLLGSTNVSSIMSDNVRNAPGTFPDTIEETCILSGAIYNTTISTQEYYYFYNLTIADDCKSIIRRAVEATVTPAPEINVSATVNNICSGSSTTLNVSSGNSNYLYSWHPGNVTGTSITVSPSNSTTYHVWAEEPAGSSNMRCATKDSINITVSRAPVILGINVTNDTDICIGHSLQLLINSENNIFSENFEDSRITNFSVDSNLLESSINTVYFAEGSASIRLKHPSRSNYSYVMTSSIDLNRLTAPVLTFSHIAALELFQPFSGDYGIVEYSTNGGLNWQAFPANTYRGSGTLAVSGTFNAPVNNIVQFNEDSYNDWQNHFSIYLQPDNSLWKHEKIDLSDFAYSTDFRIRFKIVSDPTIEYYGWMIDDIKISNDSLPLVFWNATPFTNCGLPANAMLADSNNHTIIITPTAFDNYVYTATLRASNGCSTNVSSGSISVGERPTLVAPMGNYLCDTSSVLLQADIIPNVSYTWYYNGIPITNASASNYMANRSGEYSVQITAHDYCSEPSPAINVLQDISTPPVVYTNNDLLYTQIGFNRYQWFLNGNLINGSNSRELYIEQSGSYKVCVTTVNLCTACSEEIAVTYNNSIQDLNVDPISIYPNPSHDIVYIDAPFSVNIHIKTADGKLLITKNDAKQINISSLANGFYFINIYDGENRLLKHSKIIKQSK